MQNITSQLFQDAQQDERQVAKRVYENYLNKDRLNAVILDGNVFWIENGAYRMPNYVYDYIVEWGEKKGHDYLFNVVPL